MARLLIDTCDLHAPGSTNEIANLARRLGARVCDVTAGVPRRPGAATEPRLFAHFIDDLHRKHLADGETFHVVELPPSVPGGLRVEDKRTGSEVSMHIICRACRDRIDASKVAAVAQAAATQAAATAAAR